MARAPKKTPAEARAFPLTPEQFAAIERWIETCIALEWRKPADLVAPKVTAKYQARQRAMLLLTGVEPPAEPEPAAPEPMVVKPAFTKGELPTSASDDDDPYDVG